jgi:hypothetical protein
MGAAYEKSLWPAAACVAYMFWDLNDRPATLTTSYRLPAEDVVQQTEQTNMMVLIG